MFCLDKQREWTDLGGGVTRKVLSYNTETMAVRVRFENGAVGEVHQHAHTQVTYVLKGKFEFTIGEEKSIINAGDTCLMPSNVLHGCVCLEAGELLDVFTPMRSDFI